MQPLPNHPTRPGLLRRAIRRTGNLIQQTIKLQQTIKRCNVIWVFVLGVSACFADERPALFLSEREAASIRAVLADYPVLQHSFEKAKNQLDRALAKPIEVPPPGEAGGYEHERHKQNYRDMRTAGLLFRITGEARYAGFVKAMLDKYAELYPTLGPHPLSHEQAPGKLFHQTLNEEV